MFEQFFGEISHFYELVLLQLDRNTENMFSISCNTATKKGKQLVYFDHQNVNSLCSRHHYVNSSCLFYVSVEL